MSSTTCRTVAMAAAVTGLLASSAVMAVPDNPGVWEKCAGIAAAGKNDCGTASHSCAGQSSASNAPDEWEQRAWAANAADLATRSRT